MPRRVVALSFALVALGAAMACGGDDPVEGAPPPEVDGGTPEASASSFCVDGKKTVDYPPGPYNIELGGILPKDLKFEGPDGPVEVASFFDPCATPGKLLVIRSSAAFCGPCIWHQEHNKRLFTDAPFADRLVVLDLLISDRDNMPARVSDLAAWRARMDATPSSYRIAIDPKFVFKTAQSARKPLPIYTFVNLRTMEIVSADSDPDPEVFKSSMAVDLADIDGQKRPPLVAPKRHDEFFTDEQWDLIRGMKLVATPPPDPTNEYGDVPAAVAFGKTLFSDKLLSPSGTVSCATCHVPSLEFSDGAKQSEGVARVDRNTPAIALSAHSRWQFWDGRADTLWMQALGPFEEPKEFGGSRLFVAQQIAARHATEYNAVFGAKYPLPSLAALPASGKPGDPAYDALPAADKENVTRIFVNVGKAIAAFERSLRVKPNALDRYIDGDLDALTTEQKTGLSAFFVAGCAQCHWGPRLTNDAFHAIRFPTGRQDGQPDVGRDAVLPNLAKGEFVATSMWSDDPSAAKPLVLPETSTMIGAFKTPTLRGIPKSGPYGHGGSIPTLLDLTRIYSERGVPHDDATAIGTTEQWLPLFDKNAQAQLPAFLDILTAEIENP